MRRQASGCDGFSLIEVMIALFVLAVAIIGVAALQASSLRASATAEALKVATGIARTEIEARVQYGLSPLASGGCVATVLPSGYECVVDVSDCAVVAGTVICGDGVVSGRIGYEISVSVVGPRSAGLTLRSFSRSIVQRAGDGG